MNENLKYRPTQTEITRIKMHSGMLKVSGDGVFFSIQGEGKSMGLPSVFLRLHVCNLECIWCDTKYTWDRNTPEFWKESQDWTIEKATDEISQFPIKRLVITGGEPMIQQVEVTNLIQKLHDWDVEIETDGTIVPVEDLKDRIQFNVSPKLSHSGNPINRRYKRNVLEILNELPGTSFKFVVRSIDDLSEVDLITQDCNLDQSKIIIMPEGITPKTIKEHGLATIEGVKLRGWRMLPRFHIDLWGTERGV